MSFRRTKCDFFPFRGYLCIIPIFMLQIDPNPVQGSNTSESGLESLLASATDEKATLVSEYDLNGDVARSCSESGGFIKFAFQCVKAGSSYDLDSETQCQCVQFLSACCIRTTTIGGSGTTSTSSSSHPHPLDPLTGDEISLTRIIIESHMKRGHTKNGALPYLFIWITLKEPPKALLLPYFLHQNMDPPKGLIPRKSFTILLERKRFGKVYEIVVNLREKRVETLTQVQDAQPQLSLYELHLSQMVMKADAKVRARCALLGFRDMDFVDGDPWSIGYIGDRPEWRGRRLVQLFMFGRLSKNDNHFAHPFDFLVVVDIQAEEVLAIENLPTGSTSGSTPVPLKGGNYDYTLRGGSSSLRKDDKPITISSPEGASYKVTGNQLTWQGWKMRLGFNGREGLILYLCSYNDNNTIRPIFYRSSLTEMFIPYGDPRPPYHRKAVYDVGNYGIGFFTTPQRLGIEVLGAATLFPACLNNVAGYPELSPGVVSVTEEDAGILWQHFDIDTNKSVVVRGHRLVISTIATVGNYDYIFLWRFYQDGAIQVEIRLSGIVSTNLLAKGGKDATAGFGNVEAPQVGAQYHQHWFAVRMDVEIDGNRNSVETCDAVPLPQETGSTKNPYGQGFTLRKTPLRTASEGRSYTNPGTGRVWVVTNPGKINPVTRLPTGYKLVTEAAPLLLMKESSPLRPEAAFLYYPVWVIPYAEDQFYPGGFYLRDGIQGGLPSWVAGAPGASIVNEDIVLFHMIDVLHIPRVEDWPVMSSEMAGFWLKPCNFFGENPAVNVPPTTGATGRSEL